MLVPTTATILMMCVSSLLHTTHGQVCQPPQSESVYFLTSTLEDLYVATDYSQGKTLVVFGDGPQGDTWFLVDTVSRNTYYSNPEDGCVYAQFSPEQNELVSQIWSQCLPSDAELERSGDVDFYHMERPGFDWLVGMKPVPDTDYFYKHFSRINSYGVYKVPDESSFGLVYQYSVGLSDPSVFDRDLSACVEGPHNMF
ncbi:hypothetical protein EGW08_006349 [Elysia chlorotica]|uniref:DOMON domain-containing protein n=1 Tax=Elysia chlorotica TaxID=188477 RepID=A0A433TWF4_ELYCH|nr:hypothetical protein EGW08_006349 [Elysia chlorotica]